LPPKVSDFASPVKKALTNMQRAGEAENPSLGYWKILPKNTEVTPDYAVGETASEENEQQIDTPDESLAEVVLGAVRLPCTFITYRCIALVLKSGVSTVGRAKSEGRNKILYRESYPKRQRLCLKSRL